jgi:S-(hydroxymethyl)glutathione dehydrogenase/alcohol dehydrogenase
MSVLMTRAAILRELEQPLELGDIAVPELLAGQVRVDLAYSGVCHTQLMEARGRKGPDRFLPHTMGHEGSGVVRAVGSAVTKVAPGDRVVLTWIKGHGCDVPSMQYHDARGIINCGAVGTFMRTALVSENRVVPIPKAMPLREAALLGCAVPTGAGIALNTVRVRPNESVAIFGIGGIGMSAILGAKLAHAYPIVAIDIRQNKLDWARRIGATHTVDASRPDFMAELREITGPQGFDYAFESAGRVESMENAIAAVRFGGGTAVLAGNLAAGKRVPLDPQDLNRGKRVLGTWGGETIPDRDIPLYARLYLEGALPLELLISHAYPLEQINDALDDLEGGRVARALLEIEPDVS